MALAQTSDDSLRLILSFLTGEDVVRLMNTGSKRLRARVAHNTTSLFWCFSRPAYFPACSFAFHNLNHLTIKASGRHGHISLQHRTLLPLEPMVSLESLVLDFPTSFLVFSPVPSNPGVCLSSSLPRLTSLAVHSRMACSLPNDWAQSLPQGILTLILNIRTSRTYRAFSLPSSFDDLPAGLQHLEIGSSCYTGDGTTNIGRFTGLRVYRIWNTHNWDVLQSLPDSLEDLALRMWNASAPTVTFPISKLPPKIRALTLNGTNISLVFDSMAPPTIEELELNLTDEVSVEDFGKFFYTKNLHVARGVEFSDPSEFSMLPSVTELPYYGRIPGELETLEILPRKLEILSLPGSKRASDSVSLKQLPPSLKEFYGSLLSARDISDLPKSLHTLQLYNYDGSSLPRVPVAFWKDLPLRLTRLEAPTELFESEECFLSLPASLKTLDLAVDPPDDLLERLSFPKSIQESLEKLSIYVGTRTSSSATSGTFNTVPPKLSQFSRLYSLRIDVKIVIKSSTLANLPKTLVKIRLQMVEFENFGLPVGQRPDNCDWKEEGALSRLPEGLISFQLDYLKEGLGSIDFKLFSHLPPRLASLKLYVQAGICQNPKSFIASLPRRLSRLEYTYMEPYDSEDDSDYEESEPDPIHKELIEAIDEYYSDPFWGDHMGERKKLSGPIDREMHCL